MKSFTKILLLSLSAVFIMASCKKDDNGPDKIIVKMGAQSNTTIGSFYSLGTNKVYTQDLAAENQDTIDLLCFYEVTDANPNYISLSSPSAIKGIYPAPTPETWAIKRLTIFTEPATPITTSEFDQLKQDDQIIQSYYNTNSNGGKGYKKAKDLKADNIWAFKTQNNIYGLLKVISVGQNADGYVEFEIKYKK